MVQLEAKVIAVTGAGGGMGKTVVENLLAEGATVVALDINTDSLSSIENENIRVKAINLLDENSIQQTFNEIFDEFNKLDGLVNIAGIAQSAKPITEVELSEWHKIIDINATAIFLTSREAVRYMKQAKNGSIINIGSVSVTRPRPGLQSYVASKGAVEAFSKALALETAPFNIRVNVLHPGPADTQMLGQFSSAQAGEVELNKDIFAESVPLGRLINPADISATVTHLLTDGAQIITGAVIHVDGGRSI
ncbi:SDR family NAD(P)-dependent oxidoreductase [Psychrobacillus lasiicapitis]|uniref:SDR family oxidoreductase n=1 Tax=Psychrobacillus lasiicapitis TaxID=1636719 RepID=A0A544THZ8_9BACI|nr:SDR family oxidoreductase [Psychrobacillus lasiicapitis]TQR17038.1 SDR family oxidoreductase [Psychrobacillus lasiicapitis]GGA25073.1 alcohol dehydrogenase [Psychrobacillus lasiicapitis]